MERVNYDKIFSDSIAAVKAEGRYRVFADLRRRRGAFPHADAFAADGVSRPITVWCSNDYLGMGQHPQVIEAMHTALDTVGAGSGGTRNISGTTHYHVELEAEIADLHGKQSALLFTSAFVANDTTLATLQALMPDVVFYLNVSPEHLVQRNFAKDFALDYWESGMDLGLSRDMFDSFLKYQALVEKQFRRLQATYGFTIVDGNQPVDDINTELRAKIEAVMAGK